jgi:hypothetical protein
VLIFTAFLRHSRFLDFLVENRCDKANSTASVPTNKPTEPYPYFPLCPHWNGRVGRWWKKIRGKLHYYGPWADGRDAALKRRLDQKDSLQAGVIPVDTSEALTVLRLTVKFLKTKQAMHERRELSIHSQTDASTTPRITNDWPRWDSNPHPACARGDFKSPVSAGRRGSSL